MHTAVLLFADQTIVSLARLIHPLGLGLPTVLAQTDRYAAEQRGPPLPQSPEAQSVVVGRWRGEVCCAIVNTCHNTIATGAADQGRRPGALVSHGRTDLSAPGACM